MNQLELNSEKSKHKSYVSISDLENELIECRSIYPDSNEYIKIDIKNHIELLEKLIIIKKRVEQLNAKIQEFEDSDL